MNASPSGTHAGGKSLSVEADLLLVCGERTCHLRGSWSQLELEIPDNQLVLRLGGLRGLTGRWKRLRSLSNLLAAVGVTLIIRTAHRRLVSLGSQRAFNPLRLLGLRNVLLHLR